MRPSAIALLARNAPAPTPVPTAAAFTLVRQLLQDRPRHFREILADGVAASGSSSAAEATASGSAAASADAKGKGKGRRKNEAEVINVPADHPFISANYLKKHILPVLESQHLIEKQWLPAKQGTQLARGGLEKKHAMWALRESTTTTPGASGRWEAITAEAGVTRAQLSRFGKEAYLETLAAEAVAKEDAFASGEVERSDRDMLTWAGRPQGLTTRLERTHLNTRRARNRPAKEAVRAGVVAPVEA